MTCRLCPRVAIYEVPGCGEKRFFFDRHKKEAFALCKKTVVQHDRPHYPESIGGFTFVKRMWM